MIGYLLSNHLISILLSSCQGQTRVGRKIQGVEGQGTVGLIHEEEEAAEFQERVRLLTETSGSILTSERLRAAVHVDLCLR